MKFPGTFSYVLRMATWMEYKLSLNRHKGDSEGWRRDEVGDIFDRIGEEVSELWDAIANCQNPEEIWKEAADVANMAMMVADTYEQEYDDD